MKVKHLTGKEEAAFLALAIRQSVAKAAEGAGISYQQATDLARSHGYPDLDAMRASHATLLAQVAEEPAQAAAAMTGRTLRTVRVADLLPDPDNPREDLGDVDGLAQSIAQSGLLQPIVARQRGTSLVVVAGHRRLAALKQLGWPETEVLVSRDMRPDDVLAAMLIENGQRRDLDPIEEARALDKLKVSNNWSATELAARVGRSTALVYERLALLGLSAEHQELVREGHMGIAQGAQIARVRAGTARTHATYRFHLGADHPLAGKARSRCLRTHGKTKVRIVGNTACGDCWESVIRADEQRNSLELSMRDGRCRTCDHDLPAQEATA